MTPSETDAFPRRLKMLMEAEGLSTRDLAGLTHGRVSHSAIAQWLSGQNKATLEQATHVANALGWDAIELLYGRAPADAVDRMVEMDATLRRVKRATELLVTATGAESAAPVPTKGVRVAGEKAPSGTSRRVAGDS